MKFKKLCEPGKIGKLEIRNRMIIAPMAVGLCSDEGFVGERIIKFLEARAKGGLGVLITGLATVDKNYPLHGGHLAVWDDKFIPGLHQLVNAVHVHGAKIFVMIWHPGRQWDGQPLAVAPSPIACRSFMYGDREVPHELTTGEVEDLVEKFAEGARRVRDAGADGVALHATHGYLIHQFFSPFTNARSDKYGGSLEGRCRFAVEIIEGVREKCGPDFPIDIRMGQDYLIPGNGVEETKKVAQIMEKAGVACIGASGGMHESTREKLYGGTTSAMGVPPGWELEDAITIKSAVSIPVFAVGGLGNDLELAESVLEKGQADFIQFGRSVIADPELPNKIMTGRIDEINWCIRCGECHPHDRDNLRRPDLFCSVNAFVGKESDPAWKITPAVKSKKVLVVGGGPGGMEAARIAALRGHDVALYEKNTELGGAIILAAVPPGKEDLGKTIKYLSHEISRLGVKVKLSTEATPELIEKMKPDTVVLATGGTPLLPDITGITGKNVYTARDVLTGKARVGERVVVIGGGGIGSEVATYLAEKGKKVTILTRSSVAELEKDIGRGRPTRLQKELMPEVWGFARELPRRYRMLVLKRLGDDGVKAIVGVEYKKITDKGITVTREGKEELIEADTIVISAGEKPNNGLYGKLYGKVPEIYLVGDCLEPRRLMDAIEDGAFAGLQI
jgi:2,4-dienoyl-CoA reductase-like NADH-dependent reductase (Old Yellow Enzyme family)/thioredoxin reductase